MRAMAVAALLWLAPSAGPRADAPLTAPERAALAALRGEPERAGEILGQGAAMANDPGALVVLASVALEQGDLDEAGRLSAHLRSVQPEGVDGKLLEALVAERRAHPDRDWVIVAIAAMKAAQPLEGRPILSDTWWPAGDRAELSPELLSRFTPKEALLARWAWRQPWTEKPDAVLVEAAVALSESGDRVVQAVVHDVLSAPASGELAAGAEAAYRRLHARLAEAGFLSLAQLDRSPVREEGVSAFAARCSNWLRGLLKPEGRDDPSPLREEEVAAIESAVARARVLPFADVYSDLLRVLLKVDTATAPGLALAGAVGFVGPGDLSHPTLSRRLKLGVSMPDPARRRLGRALVRVAELQQEQGTLLGDLLAVTSFSEAAKLLPDDAALQARAERWRTQALARLNASWCFWRLALPIRSLHLAWARAIAAESRLLEQGTAMGLSCPDAGGERGSK